MASRRINKKRLGLCWTIAAEPTSGSLEEPENIRIFTSTNKKNKISYE